MSKHTTDLDRESFAPNHKRCVSSCLVVETQRIGGKIRLCLGQIRGIEKAISALRREFDNENCGAAILLDATKAFSLLNRTTALEKLTEWSLLATYLLQTPTRQEAAFLLTK